MNDGLPGKVAPAHRFADLSDYAQPFARWLVKQMLPTKVTPNHVTLAFTAVGLLASVLLALERWRAVAAGLLLLKSGLDAADGGLARARQRPSRAGRFLDSVCDFVVNVAVYLGIGWAAFRRHRRMRYLVLAFAALLSGLLQVSLYNHYYVRHRAQTRGDTTSLANEAGPAGYAWDDPVMVRRLHRLYRVIYGWQDSAVAWADRLAAGSVSSLSPRFLTASSLLGLGTQLLVIAVCTVLGQPVLALWLLASAFNLYALALLAVRHKASHPKTQ
jgi:phosphatidylglycerophosphate synthase